MSEVFKIAYRSFLFVSFLFSCHHSPRMSTMDRSDTCLRPFYRLPDSLLTADEVQAKQKYLRLLLTYLTVENNRYVFRVSKDSFLRGGIPGIYYDQLIESVEETNRWAEQMHIDSLSVLFQHAREELKKQTEGF